MAQRRKIYKIKLAIILIMLIVVIGISGYMLLEKFNFIEALYMTVITISSVGFQEIHPLDTAGRLFTIFLIISGIGIVLYSFSIIAASIIEGELGQYFKNYRTKFGIKKWKSM